MAHRRSSLASKTSRASLPSDDHPEWEVISPGVRLGYRRGRGSYGRGGTWLAASRSGSGKRQQLRLGRADDTAPADGKLILSHEQAKDAARAWAKALKTGSDAAQALTVNAALDRYFEARSAEGMKTVEDAKTRAAFHIRPKLGNMLVTHLTIDKVRSWRDSMVSERKGLRTARFANKANFVLVDLSDPETIRRRRDTANRTLTTLKAALNWAFNNRLVVDDTAWRLVKAYRGTAAARVRFLAPDEQKRLVAASNGAIRDLVSAALVTGARFSELARLQIADYDAANQSIFIAVSKSGKPRHIPLPAGGANLFQRLTSERKGHEPLLRQDNGRPWQTSTYNRPWKELLHRAKLSEVTLHELRHTYASTMVRGGAPLMIVAQALGHSDTRMVEKHYAHLAPSYVADTIRRLAPDI